MLVLTREPVREHLANVTVAPITTTVKGLSTEVPVGRRNGLDHDCVASCDNITTVPQAALGRHVGMLFDDQERALTQAIRNAFALSD